MADRCLRTQFISSMAAPLSSSALLMACLSSKLEPGGRHREQRRPAAGDQAQHEVVGAQALHRIGDARCGALAGGVGHRMRSFDDLDAARLALVCRRHVLVARDDQPRQRRVLRPQRIDRSGHRAAGLAGADDERAALRRRRQEAPRCSAPAMRARPPRRTASAGSRAGRSGATRCSCAALCERTSAMAMRPPSTRARPSATSWFAIISSARTSAE